MQTFEGISSGLDEIAGLMGSCKIYDRIHSSRTLESSRAVIEQLPLVYAAMLVFTAEAISYSNTGSVGKDSILIWQWPVFYDFLLW